MAAWEGYILYLFDRCCEADAWLIAGCGKSILWYDPLPAFHTQYHLSGPSSTVIEHVLAFCSRSPEKSAAYYYFDFNEIEKQNTRNLTKSLIAQLRPREPPVPQPLRDLYRKCKDGTHSATLGDLKAVLRTILGQLSDIYIVIDALDECPRENGERERLLRFLREIYIWSLENIHVCLTSRNGKDIQDALDPFVGAIGNQSISVESEAVGNDINYYISNRLNSPSFSSWPKDLKVDTEVTLSEKADGM